MAPSNRLQYIYFLKFLLRRSAPSVWFSDRCNSLQRPQTADGNIRSLTTFLGCIRLFCLLRALSSTRYYFLFFCRRHRRSSDRHIIFLRTARTAALQSVLHVEQPSTYSTFIPMRVRRRKRGNKSTKCCRATMYEIEICFRAAACRLLLFPSLSMYFSYFTNT